MWSDFRTCVARDFLLDVEDLEVGREAWDRVARDFAEQRGLAHTVAPGKAVPMPLDKPDRRLFQKGFNRARPVAVVAVMPLVAQRE